MELKHWSWGGWADTAGGFNRTFMELKPKYEWSRMKGEDGFNRTFMELKLTDEMAATSSGERFNRTFMELKPENWWQVGDQAMVLIAPLWN